LDQAKSWDAEWTRPTSVHLLRSPRRPPSSQTTSTRHGYAQHLPLIPYRLPHTRTRLTAFRFLPSASKPRSTRSSFPSLPPTVPSGSNRSSSSSSRDGSPSANAIAHMQYTQSLGALGKKERGRKKGSTGPNAHDGDVSLDSSAADQQEDEDETRSTNQRRSSVDVGGRGAKRDASVVKKEQSEGGSIPLGKKGAAAAAAARAQEEEEEDEDEDDEEGADITRCVCGITGQSCSSCFPRRPAPGES
jgi:hypothetical protein